MKIVQTFWSGGQKSSNPLDNHSGWLAPEHHWMSWALSCLLLRRHYKRVELYTDEVGKVVLIDMLKLPYTKVHVVFDEIFKIHPKLFALSKLYTYNLQDEHFIHIDGDVFLWHPLPQKILDAGLLASNLEHNLYFNKEILEDVESNFTYIPEYLQNIHGKSDIFSSNAGIFGGKNTPFIKEYSKLGLQFIEFNKAFLAKVSTGHLNFLVEQISLFYLARQRNLDIVYFIDEPVQHPLYEDYWCFADIPNVKIIHPVGGCKKNPYVQHHLTQRLRLEFPEVYYDIIRLCKNTNIEVFNSVYKFIDLDKMENENELLDNSTFPKLFDADISKIHFGDFQEVYRRTLRVIEYNDSTLTIDENIILVEYIGRKEVPEQIKEIFHLESQIVMLKKQLFKDMQKGRLYGLETQHYKNTSSLFLTSEILNKKVTLMGHVLLLELGWDWNTTDNPLDNNRLERMFGASRETYLITISYHILDMSVWETHHQGLDALILKCLQKPKSILNLLEELKVFFDEEIQIENKKYQQLVFDILKRMAFINILKIIK